ncbi:MAG: hypothetical protein V3T31_01255, partial [candidate division Zixibacteria bacterium]
MNRSSVLKRLNSLTIITGLMLLAMTTQASSQSFDFAKLSGEVADFTLVMKMKVEVSFGMQSTEHEQRLLATIISPDGLVVFDGTSLEFDHPFAGYSPVTVKTTPSTIEFVSTDGSETYAGECVGSDPYTKLAFARIVNTDGRRFDYVQFVPNSQPVVGDWLSLFMLLPEYISPPLASD